MKLSAIMVINLVIGYVAKKKIMFLKYIILCVGTLRKMFKIRHRMRLRPGAC